MAEFLSVQDSWKNEGACRQCPQKEKRVHVIEGNTVFKETPWKTRCQTHTQWKAGNRTKVLKCFGFRYSRYTSAYGVLLGAERLHFPLSVFKASHDGNIAGFQERRLLIR